MKRKCGRMEERNLLQAPVRCTVLVKKVGEGGGTKYWVVLAY